MKKIVLITGASSGIGLETSKLLLERSHTVIMVSRKIQSSIIKKDLKGDFFLFDADLRKEKDIIKLFDFVKTKFKFIDILINNAGYINPKGLFETSLENWENTISINLTATFLCSKYGAKLMKENGGKIINISSTSGLGARPGLSAYASSKSAVINFSYSIAEELKAYGIRIYIICPGPTATPLRKLIAPEENPKKIMQAISVAKAINLCIGDEMNLMEGQTIIVKDRIK